MLHNNFYDRLISPDFKYQSFFHIYNEDRPRAAEEGSEKNRPLATYTFIILDEHQENGESGVIYTHICPHLRAPKYDDYDVLFHSPLSNFFRELGLYISSFSKWRRLI